MEKEFPDGGRYCLHDSLRDTLHSMIIYNPPDQEYPKHMHADTDEMYIVLEGSMTISVFDGPMVTEKIQLSAGDTDIKKIHVIKKFNWHSVLSGKNGVKFVECRNGPFDKSKTFFESC